MPLVQAAPNFQFNTPTSTTVNIVLPKKEEKMSDDIFLPENLRYLGHKNKLRGKYDYLIENPNPNSHIKFYTNRPKSDDVAIPCVDKKDMYRVMHEEIAKINVKESSPNFVLGMLTDNNEYQVWVRKRQPCQGGEMRRYGISHDNCTRPSDPRPADLHYPYPDGTTLAVGVSFNSMEDVYINHARRNKNFTFLYDIFIHQDSPYRRAYTSEDNVEKVFLDEKAIGLLIKDANLLDPTIFVTMCNNLRYGNILKENSVLLEHCSIPTFILISACRITPTLFSHQRECYTHFLHTFDVRKILKGIEATRDLTGGSLGAGFDYNRPEIDNIFNPPGNEYNHLIRTSDLFKQNAIFSNTITKDTIFDCAKRVEDYLRSKME